MLERYIGMREGEEGENKYTSVVYINGKTTLLIKIKNLAVNAFFPWVFPFFCYTDRNKPQLLTCRKNKVGLTFIFYSSLRNKTMDISICCRSHIIAFQQQTREGRSECLASDHTALDALPQMQAGRLALTATGVPAPSTDNKQRLICLIQRQKYGSSEAISANVIKLRVVYKLWKMKDLELFLLSIKISCISSRSAVLLLMHLLVYHSKPTECTS